MECKETMRDTHIYKFTFMPVHSAARSSAHTWWTGCSANCNCQKTLHVSESESEKRARERKLSLYM
jgi:hypothetical protein